MVNLDTFEYREKKMYMSAYEYYDGMVDRNNNNIEDAIRSAINKTMTIFGNEVKEPEILKKYLYEQISMVREQESDTFITNEEVRNSTWWDDYKKDNRTDYWQRYSRYLMEDKNWDRSLVENGIDKTTNKVMNALSNPQINISMERKGMVVGHVQSGKTAHYIGLINKAIDSGYKIIIVLAGMHNNLRSQTQSRIDEEVLGFETSLEYISEQMKQIPNRIGVGRKYNTNVIVQTLTTRDENGDFNKKRAGVLINPDNTTVFIVKKQYKVLEYLIEYFKHNPSSSYDKQSKKHFMSSKYPLLLIDDEADQASVNTNYEIKDGEIYEFSDPSKINMCIRQLFQTFECRSYVGYTATPYANIFIPNKINNESYGNDLFPTNFILSLPKSSKYIGANEFFGDEDHDEMPLRRRIKSQSLDFIDRKNKIVGELPEDLQEAIISFLISISIRTLRGQIKKPNTMLIHVARIVDMQKLVHTKVSEFFEDLGNKIVDGNKNTILNIKHIWENDYIQTTNDMIKNHSKYVSDVIDLEWDDILKQIKKLILGDMVKIYSINGKSKDALLYKENRDKQYNVIAIGGDKLSRGLTLEGLTISYFTRESKMYDTLMQMGRWFGFRQGYADLCRLYVPDILYGWFKHISFATENLREQIDFMNNIEECPEKFGLRVATHPNMKISNDKKILSGEERYITFSNTLSQTRSIDIDGDKYNRNFEATERLLKTCGMPIENYWDYKKRRDNSSKHKFWIDVNGHHIAKFLIEFETSQNANKANSKYMAEYIKNQMKYGGLVNWTVCLINMGEPNKINISGINIGSGIERSRIDKIGEKACSIKTLTSEGHEYFDFTGDEMEKIEEINKIGINGKKPSKDYIRKMVRNRKNGLLIIYPIDIKRGNGGMLIDKSMKHKNPLGIAIVFPDNKEQGDLVSYRINDIGKRGNDDELFD